MKNKQLARQIGEHLVVAELGRRGILATPFAGNVPDIDLLIYANGRSLPIQVKTRAEGDLTAKATKYLDIQFQGDKQIIKGKINIERSLIFVLVKTGAELGDAIFYIYEQGVAQDLIFKGYSAFLKKHNDVRPRNKKSTHAAYHIKDLYKYKDNWTLITDRLGVDVNI